MTSRASSSVMIQTSACSVPATPSWLGEVTLLDYHLQRQGVFAALQEQVRFARRRFGRYDVIDFVAVLFGYAISSERTLEAFYKRLQPWASVFMALFGRDRLPARSTLSRFLTALDQVTIEALRTLFLQDLLACPLAQEEPPGGLWDRHGNHFLIFDIDGTREAARQRALPQTADRPAPQRRFGALCAPGYTGRKRGEVVRTRTTVLQAVCPLVILSGEKMGKSSAPARPSCRRIRISGSAPLETLGTASTGKNCVGLWPLCTPICRRTSFRRNRPCRGWMGSMAAELSSPT